MLRRNAAAGRAAGLDGFKRTVFDDAAADVKAHSAQSRPHFTSISPAFLTFPTRQNTLPDEFSVPSCRQPVARHAQEYRAHWQKFHYSRLSVCPTTPSVPRREHIFHSVRRFYPQSNASTRRIRRIQSAGPAFNGDVKVKIGIQNIVPQKFWFWHLRWPSGKCAIAQDIHRAHR